MNDIDKATLNFQQEYWQGLSVNTNIISDGSMSIIIENLIKWNRSHIAVILYMKHQQDVSDELIYKLLLANSQNFTSENLIRYPDLWNTPYIVIEKFMNSSSVPMENKISIEIANLINSRTNTPNLYRYLTDHPEIYSRLLSDDYSLLNNTDRELSVIFESLSKSNFKIFKSIIITDFNIFPFLEGLNSTSYLKILDTWVERVKQSYTGNHDMLSASLGCLFAKAFIDKEPNGPDIAVLQVLEKIANPDLISQIISSCKFEIENGYIDKKSKSFESASLMFKKISEKIQKQAEQGEIYPNVSNFVNKALATFDYERRKADETLEKVDLVNYDFDKFSAL